MVPERWEATPRRAGEGACFRDAYDEHQGAKAECRMKNAEGGRPVLSARLQKRRQGNGSLLAQRENLPRLRMGLWLLTEPAVAANLLIIGRRLLRPSTLHLNDRDLHAGAAAGRQRDEKPAGLPLGKSKVQSLKSKVRAQAGIRHPAANTRSGPARTRTAARGFHPPTPNLKAKAAQSARDAKSSGNTLQWR